jgi:NAD(P)-dependent dehydrogenase (short-subunit alcohol dehydrogenase family)
MMRLRQVSSPQLSQRFARSRQLQCQSRYRASLNCNAICPGYVYTPLVDASDAAASITGIALPSTAAGRRTEFANRFLSLGASDERYVKATATCSRRIS